MLKLHIVLIQQQILTRLTTSQPVLNQMEAITPIVVQVVLLKPPQTHIHGLRQVEIRTKPVSNVQYEMLNKILVPLKVLLVIQLAL